MLLSQRLELYYTLKILLKPAKATTASTFCRLMNNQSESHKPSEDDELPALLNGTNTGEDLSPAKAYSFIPCPNYFTASVITESPQITPTKLRRQLDLCKETLANNNNNKSKSILQDV